MRHIEDMHQEALIQWANITYLPKRDYIKPGEKIGDFLYAIPNGGKRSKMEGIKLKRQGVKAGVSDLHLPVPMNGCHGLWIEMKKPKVKGESQPKVSESQQKWLDDMTFKGSEAHVCYGWEHARNVIEKYLSMKQTARIAV